MKAQTYDAKVRPILEYACAAWDPHIKKYKDSLETVQKKAARFVTSCRSREPGSMTNTMYLLGWKPLEQRRKCTRLTHLHKILTGKNTTVRVPQHFIPQPSRYQTRNYHLKRFLYPRSQTNAHKNSFFPRTISDWNELQSKIIDIESTERFRQALDDEHVV